MKKLIFIFLVFVLFSCEKDTDKSCWDCYVKSNLTGEILSNDTYCDITDMEVQGIMQTKTVSGKTWGICYNKKFR